MERQQLKAHEIVRSLVEVGQFLSIAKEPLETRLGRLMSSTAELLSCDRCALYLWNGEAYSNPISDGTRPGDDQRAHVIPGDTPLLAQVRAAGGFVVINDARSHPTIARFAEQTGVESIVISIIDDVDGTPIAFAAAEFHTNLTSFSDLDAEVIAGVGILAREAIFAQRARALSLLSEQARRKMLDRLEDAAEHERRRIGRDIHDDLLQRVSSLAHFLELAAGDALTDKKRDRLLWLHQEARGSAIALRRLVQYLDPLDAESTSLRSVLDSVVAAANVRGEANATLTVRSDFPTSVAVTTAVHRIVRQAVDNALEHAQASRIDIVLDSTELSTLIDISDNGVGFALDRIQPGIGLFSMAERARQLEGECAVSSTLGEGSRVSAWIPHGVDQRATADQ